MIREFKLKRMFFVPVGFLNSVARWCLGIRSSDGSVEITNTADPGSNGSADLRVNIESVSNRIRERFDTMGFSEAERNSVKAIIRGTMDGVSIVNIGEHFGVSESWITQTIEKNIGDSFVEKGSTFVDGKYAVVSGGKLVTTDDDPLTEDDIGVSVCSEDDYEALLDDCQALADDVDSILADYLTSADIGVSVAAQNHTHSGYALEGHEHNYALVNHTHMEYAAVNHTHAGYAAANHTHSGYSAEGHTHNKSDITNFDNEVLAHIPACYRGNPTLYNTVPNNYVMFYIPGSGGASGTVAYANMSDQYATKNHTHTGYAAADHTHSGYAAASHTHSGYAAANHTHGDYALSSTVSDLTTVVQGISDNYLTSADLTTILSAYSNTSTISSTYATKTELNELVEDLEGVLTTEDIPANFITAIASRKSGNFTFLTNIQFDGTNLQKKTRTVTITQGVVTNLGTESAWSTWHTPTVITWS